MNTRFETLGNIILAAPQGRLDFGAAAGFQSELEHALAGAANAPSGLIVDCAGLDYVSSAGLRVFLVVSRAAKRAGTLLALCSLKPAVKDVFDVSGFSELIAVHADRAAALARMKA
ncbi:MAG TPA: STAS domain-containing protein [Steroidobacteraceae bacterium]|nr:STAS domain-containing protein [Steroidobacteraceae bacterium]